MPATPTDKQDRWWIVAAFVAIIGAILVVIMWNYPTSWWVWLLAGIVLVFVVVFYLNPRYRYWHRANACFGAAGVLAFVPSFVARAQLENIGAFEFASDASPIVVLGFLLSGLVLCWFDFRQNSHSHSGGTPTATNSNPQTVGSPHAITGLAAGGDIVINQGISKDAILEMLDILPIASRMRASSRTKSCEVDEDLVWRLIDDIKAARRQFEREDVVRLLTDLEKTFEQSGATWSKVLRTEALLLMAEEERASLLCLRDGGHQIDLTKLQRLLKELGDV